MAIGSIKRRTSKINSAIKKVERKLEKKREQDKAISALKSAQKKLEGLRKRASK